MRFRSLIWSFLFMMSGCYHQSFGQHCDKEEENCNSDNFLPPADYTLTLLLLGKTGAGKSSTGNTIFNDETAFKTSDSSASCTKDVQTIERNVDGRKLVVVDTPGFMETDDPETAMNKLFNAIYDAPSGLDALLIVVRYPNRMTEEELKAVDMLFETFGDNLRNYALVIVTGGHTFHFLYGNSKTFDEILQEDAVNKESIAHLISKCHGNYVLINHFYKQFLDSETIWKNQVKDLVTKVDDIRKKNYGKPYSNEMFDFVQKQRKEKEEQIRKEEEAKLREQMLKEQLENEKKERETQEEMHRREMELREEMNQIMVQRLENTRLQTIRELEEMFNKKKSCFPAGAMVTKFPGVFVPIETINPGDFILTAEFGGEEYYTEVYMNGHQDDHSPLPVVVMETNNTSLSISFNHYIPVDEPTTYKIAADVVAGDVIFTATNDGVTTKLIQQELLSVRSDVKRGMYNPMTMSGTLLVDGVLVSCYENTVSASHAHFFMGAVRALYRISPQFVNMVNSGRINGMPSWAWYIAEYFK